MTAPIEFRPCWPDQAPAAGLIAEMVDEMIALYQIRGRKIGVPLRLEELAPPNGVYLVGWAGTEPAAGGGVRMVTPDIAEMKRMYVRSAFRGQRIAKALLMALEDEARRLGAHTARLDTGPKQPVAQGLYERSGYRPIGNWNDNPDASYWGEKPLR